jgi:hypothetical protein
MIYYGTEKAELIYFHLDDDENDLHFILMERDYEEPVFYVRTCCNSDWEWKFYDTASNYEMVKHAIFDAGFDCENMEDYLFELDGIFEEIFNEIVIWDCDETCDATCDCETGCKHCGCK